MPGNQALLIAEIVTKIQDVEDIAKIGAEHESCPYYASRKSLQDSQIVLVPYNSILHKNTRVSSGIDLRGNVLVIDEAHNILEAIERMHSATITGRNIIHCYSQLAQYQKRYANPKNYPHHPIQSPNLIIPALQIRNPLLGKKRLVSQSAQFLFKKIDQSSRRNNEITSE